jgi:hypothetical protein
MTQQNSAIHKDIDVIIDVSERSCMETLNASEKVKPFNSKKIFEMARRLTAEAQVAC